MTIYVVNSLQDICNKDDKNFIAIGKWDGIHLGHQHIIKKLVNKAKIHGGRSIVLSFDRHPASVLRPGSEPPQLQSISERTEMLNALSVDVHLVLPFNEEFAMQSPYSFINDTLIKKLNVHEVIVGYNFNFGKDRQGTPDMLEKVMGQNDRKAEIIPPFIKDGERVSSTLIRKLLSEGNVEKASRLLGRPVSFNGLLSKDKINHITAPKYEVEVNPKKQTLGTGSYSVNISNLSGGTYSRIQKGFLSVFQRKKKVFYELSIDNAKEIIVREKIKIQLLKRVSENYKEDFQCQKTSPNMNLEMLVANLSRE